MADLIVAEMVKQARRFFTCEFKLKVAECYNSNEKTILHTTNKFKIEKKQVRNQIAGEETKKVKGKMHEVGMLNIPFQIMNLLR